MKIVETALAYGGRLTGYLHEASPEMTRTARPAILICPGGAYEFLSDREKDPPALAFFAAGFQAFVLDYAVLEAAGAMRPLVQASDAVRRMRENAEAWRIRPDAVALLGFSAGGHLAASLGTLWADAHLGAPDGQNRPDACVLCYPVISAGIFAHRVSLDRVSGGDKALEALFSLEAQVTKDTPPTFLWHTQDDELVPVENTLLFASALRKAGVPFEMHVFESGQHGLSMSNHEVDTPNAACEAWFALALKWLRARFGFDD
ncbi:MAG: alpha/beta hydrolase [Clostridia bacterium]